MPTRLWYICRCLSSADIVSRLLVCLLCGFCDVFAVQMEYLLSHIEKLMNHLKHEASAKVKAYNAAAKYDAELESLRNKNAILAQRNATRERVITELKASAVACC